LTLHYGPRNIPYVRNGFLTEERIIGELPDTPWLFVFLPIRENCRGRLTWQKRLGVCGSLWKDLETRLENPFGPLRREWRYYGKTSGWVVRLIRDKRTVLILIPCQGYFIVSFTSGETTTGSAHAAGLPDDIPEVIDHAKISAEGRNVRIEVRKSGSGLTGSKPLLSSKWRADGFINVHIPGGAGKRLPAPHTSPL
jgi:hypothetical protein